MRGAQRRAGRVLAALAAAVAGGAASGCASGHDGCVFDRRVRVAPRERVDVAVEWIDRPAAWSRETTDRLVACLRLRGVDAHVADASIAAPSSAAGLLWRCELSAGSGGETILNSSELRCGSLADRRQELLQAARRQHGLPSNEYVVGCFWLKLAPGPLGVVVGALARLVVAGES